MNNPSLNRELRRRADTEIRKVRRPPEYHDHEDIARGKFYLKGEKRAESIERGRREITHSVDVLGVKDNVVEESQMACF